MRGSAIALLLLACLSMWVSADEFDRAKLGMMRAEMAEGKWGVVDRVYLLHRGEVIFDESFDHIKLSSGIPGPYNYEDARWHPYYRESELHTVQSITKSVLATLVGTAIQKGLLDGLDQPVGGFFERPLPEQLKLRHLHPPGETFRYNSGLPQMVAKVLEKSTGDDLEVVAESLLFTPLGIDSAVWKRSPSSEVDAQGGLYLEAESLAKIGQLHLQDGVWEGTRLLPEGWLTGIRSSPVSAYDGLDYSLGWWMVSHQGNLSTTGIGYRGQRLYIVPEKELVLVNFSWNSDPRVGPNTGEILARFLEALE